MDLKHFFDSNTATFTYIVSDQKTNKCAIIDSVLDYDLHSGRTDTKSAENIINYIKEKDLEVEWILETHAHADHLTASNYLQQQLGGKIAIDEHIKDVLKFWVPLFNTSENTPVDGSQFDHLFVDQEIFYIGSTEVKVIYTPGHTPACVCYLTDNSIFVGDTIFMPYVGTARTDFPGGSAEQLYDSIQKILQLPNDTKIYTCHDYPPNNQTPQSKSTVEQQKLQNVMVNKEVSKEQYIKKRNDKDQNMEVPRLLLPSIQVNIRAGQLPTPEDNNTSYIKIPLNKL